MLSFPCNLVGDTPTRDSVYGTIAGATSKVLVYPLDTGKKMLQVYRLSPRQLSVSDFVKTNLKETGVRGLYAGVVAAVLKSGLSSGLLFGFYAFSKKYMWHQQWIVC